MRTIPKIETVETPEIGKWYLVPHVCIDICLEKYEQINKLHNDGINKYPPQFPLYSSQYKKEKVYHSGIHLPVIGVHHEDAKELKFDAWHYHVDFRFVAKRMITHWTEGKHWNNWGTYKSDIEKPCPFGERNKYLGKPIKTELLKDHKIVYLRRKMLREQPVFPNTDGIKDALKGYIGKKWACGKICPHKGTPLTGAKKDARGNILCPTHGLAFNKKGVCVERFKNASEERDYVQTLETLKNGK